MCARTLQDRTAQGGVRAGVGDQHGLHAGQHPVLVACRGELHLHCMALGMVFQAFLTAETHLDRTPGMPGHQRGMMLYAHVLLAAEPAAHQHGPAMDLFRCDAQHMRDLTLFVVHRLGAGIEQKTAVAVRLCDGALGLQKRVVGKRGTVFTRDLIAGFPDGTFRIPAT